MSKSRQTFELFRPWGGFLLGAVGLALAHQVGSDSVFDDCAKSPAVPLIFCLVGLGLIGAGAFGSWAVWRREGEGPARRLIAIVCMMAAAVFAFAALMPVLAALVIPACAA
jgi:hypothetical protein